MKKVRLYRSLVLSAIVSLAIALFLLNPNLFSPQTFWLTILALSIAWFFIEIRTNQKNKIRVKVALSCGLLLTLIDLLMNYQGTVFGLYSITPTSISILADPIELPLIAFFSGAAFSLALPERVNFLYLVVLVLSIAFIGTVVEVFLNRLGIMTYYAVDSLDAFFTYALVFAAFLAFNYLLLKNLRDNF